MYIQLIFFSFNNKFDFNEAVSGKKFVKEKNKLDPLYDLISYRIFFLIIKKKHSFFSRKIILYK